MLVAKQENKYPQTHFLIEIYIYAQKMAIFWLLFLDIKTAWKIIETVLSVFFTDILELLILLQQHTWSQNQFSSVYEMDSLFTAHWAYQSWIQLSFWFVGEHLYRATSLLAQRFSRSFNLEVRKTSVYAIFEVIQWKVPERALTEKILIKKIHVHFQKILKCLTA